MTTKTRLFALIIGINKYEHAGQYINNLNCAVADAEAMLTFLTKTMNVDSSYIRVLRNEEATREAIIDNFMAFKNDERIERDDPILIFYAGHGSEVNAPSDWKGPGGRDMPKIQMILPHNFMPTTTSDPQQQGIFDYTLSNLLSQVAQEKGNNIVCAISLL
jgi:hypothetical protein